VRLFEGLAQGSGFLAVAASKIGELGVSVRTTLAERSWSAASAPPVPAGSVTQAGRPSWTTTEGPARDGYRQRQPAVPSLAVAGVSCR
jgi:hypothetical protein